ncbi:helix-turn-helix domain-containing protein [Maribius pontilimi]|uniref:Helix-turn-helix domain-containing protein n=1 Tax=Palleronia pontilimi TaxID=1964209 RepID=A0A934MCI8_9RHOB|nr:helix-turn-helix domain-containing protein [Palleronia pontilimi]MBJ3762555.1 helix-turn-helix domain-containing protein [Palleronia pontilimi]
MHLERLIRILEVVGDADDSTVAEICDRAGLPKPTAYRLVQDLAGAGLLEPVSRGRFAIGARLKRIVHGAQSDRALLAVVGPVLKAAATEHGAAFFLSRLRGKAVEIIRVETPDTGVSYLHPGLGKRPMHACSCAKAIAAHSPGLFATDDMAGRLRAYTEFTVTDADDLQAEFAAIRQRGYAECVEEIERGLCSVAAPLAPGGPGATMSIGATGSTRVFTPEFRAELGLRITAIAQDLATRMGWDTASDAKAAG